ncbi:MAG TPA: DUF4381 domain-containing protein [Rhodanobacteraceae bacterium]|nr:DUF4381 domain-containing protein [Rhodanobacteraceae bacterium]
MNASGPVLRDIHLPPAAWWPPAPGWWILAAAVLLVIGVVAWLLWRHAMRRPLRAALREVDSLEVDYARNRDATQLVDGASRLLRRVARRIDPGVASRSGDTWRAFVQRHGRDLVTQEALDDLVEARFRAHPAPDTPVLFAALRTWCRNALRGGLRARKRPNEAHEAPAEAAST